MNMYIHKWKTNAKSASGRNQSLFCEQAPVCGNIEQAIESYHQENHDWIDYVETYVLHPDDKGVKTYEVIDVEQIIEDRDVEANPEKYGKRPRND